MDFLYGLISTAAGGLLKLLFLLLLAGNLGDSRTLPRKLGERGGVEEGVIEDEFDEVP
jgi:hypothetical protein